MDLLVTIFIVFGLGLLEIAMSLDNAIINAEILKDMSDKGKKWFVTFGIFISVFMVRGMLPWLIIFSSNPSLGLLGSLRLSFSSSEVAVAAIESNSFILLTAGGIFLVYLFLYWLLLERSNIKLYGKEDKERHRSVFILSAISIFLLVALFAFRVNKKICVAALAGVGVFLLVLLIREKASTIGSKSSGKKLSKSDTGKIVYLEVLDAAFSLDGIFGAFAFTFSIPLILLGNGIGAIAVRQLTLRSIGVIKKYKYLKHGAMASILALGIIMIADSFYHNIPDWLSPSVTFFVIGCSLVLSIRSLKKSLAQNTLS